MKEEELEIKMEPLIEYDAEIHSQEINTKIPLSVLTDYLSEEMITQSLLTSKNSKTKSETDKNSADLVRKEITEAQTASKNCNYKNGHFSSQTQEKETCHEDVETESHRLQNQIVQKTMNDKEKRVSVDDKFVYSNNEFSPPKNEGNSKIVSHVKNTNDLSTSSEEMTLMSSLMSSMEASGEDLYKNPEFLACLQQEVKIKLMQDRLERERPIQMVGLKDHTYMIPRTNKRISGSCISWHECYHCKRRFPPNRRHRYLTHLRTHSGERPFKCKICERGFNRQDHLNVHMRLHTGEKPFSCSKCDTSFTHKTSLLNHKCNKK